MPTFAAVDIGSNSVRLKIARLTRGRLDEIHEDREVTRLGESVFRSGFLSPDAIANTVKVLRRFHRAVQDAGADVVRVVGTSALRDARNSHAFHEWVRSATGWTVEIISGIEEARLIHLGLVSGQKMSTSPTLMLDLGGGSCELTVSVKGHIRSTVSLPLGAVRLTNEFLRTDPPKKTQIRQMEAFISREIQRTSERIRRAAPRTVIATSGTAESLALVCRGIYKSKTNTGVVSRIQLRGIAKRLARMPLEKRRQMSGIGPRRAEIIIAGAFVFAELAERCELPGFRYSPLGLRDGLLAQMVADFNRGTRSGKQIESERWDSILAAVEHYHVDLDHALQVRETALLIFDKMRGLHGLTPDYREWLSAAAMLYEVGDYVNRNGRHRHAYYIISQSEILGYTPEQRKIIGAIARYLGKSRPVIGIGPMEAVATVQVEAITKASLLLRLARALNLSRSGAVGKATITNRGDEVRLAILPKARSSVDLELWAVEKERPYFREVFGRELTVAAA